MRRVILALVVGLMAAAMFGGVASAHPILPASNGNGAVAGGTVAHNIGLACAEDVSPAVGVLGLTSSAPCVVDAD